MTFLWSFFCCCHSITFSIKQQSTRQCSTVDTQKHTDTHTYAYTDAANICRVLICACVCVFVLHKFVTFEFSIEFCSRQQLFEQNFVLTPKAQNKQQYSHTLAHSHTPAHTLNSNLHALSKHWWGGRRGWVFTSDKNETNKKSKTWKFYIALFDLF